LVFYHFFFQTAGFCVIFPEIPDPNVNGVFKGFQDAAFADALRTGKNIPSRPLYKLMARPDQRKQFAKV
jgi:hypothetical protein